MQKPIHTKAQIVGRNDADMGGKYFEVHLKLQEPVIYQPGQYLNIVIDGQRRSYSITTLPSPDCRDISLLVERLPGGLASGFLDIAPINTTVELILPFGRLTPRTDKVSSHVLIGTGSGIASLRPIAQWLLEYNPQQCRVDLLWGARCRENLFWLHWLEHLTRTFTNFSCHITISRPDSLWTGLRGYVTEHLTSIEPDAQFYLCGGRAMIEDVRALLKAYGVEPANILTEQFHV